MATLNDLFPSKFLTKEDIGAGSKYTIVGVTQENVGKDEDPVMKPALHFNETKKPFILNKTNGESIAEAYGNNTEGWNGKEIVIYFDPTIMFGGKKTGGMRVRPPKGVVVDPSDDLPY